MASIQPKITINGVASTSITGLMICSLPPISKAPLRAQAEEIDGRDGDVITKLGYGAYDKPFTIGLSGSYDIDAVIGYFNSEGKITFSNEPEKYYLFSQFDQIDFEKLIRFKTADVVVHVQPFKYSTTEAEIVKTFSAQTGSKRIRNSGNYFSKPVITIEGSGNVEITLGGNLAVALDMSTTSKIILDTDSLNATDDSGNLKNRLVTGSLENLYFAIGNNDIGFNGSVTKISVKNYSRWL